MVTLDFTVAGMVITLITDVQQTLMAVVTPHSSAVVHLLNIYEGIRCYEGISIKCSHYIASATAVKFVHIGTQPKVK